MSENIFSILVLCDGPVDALKETIASIKAQSFKSVDVIIVGNGQTPSFESIEAGFSMRLFHSEYSKGISPLIIDIDKAFALHELFTFIRCGAILAPHVLARLQALHASDPYALYDCAPLFESGEMNNVVHHRVDLNDENWILDCEGRFITRELFLDESRNQRARAGVPETRIHFSAEAYVRFPSNANNLEGAPTDLDLALDRSGLSEAEKEDVRFGTSHGLDGSAVQRLLEKVKLASLFTAVSQSMLRNNLAYWFYSSVLRDIDWTRDTQLSEEWYLGETNPTFTILIATFNAESELDVTLRSILAQNRRDIECIVIDGGSSDRTIEILMDNHPHVVTRFISQRDDGLYDALNKGLSLARGNLIGIVGAGDCYLPGALDEVALAHATKDAHIYGGQTIERAANGRVHMRKDEPWGLNAFVSGGPVGHNAMFATRAAYERVGYFGKAYPMAEDTRWMHRAIHIGMMFHYIATPLVLFPLTGMSNNNPELVWDEASNLIKQNFPEIDLTRQEALDLLFVARAWAEPELCTSVLKRHNSVSLNISAALAIAAQNVSDDRATAIFDGINWRHAAALFAKNKCRPTYSKVDTPFFSFVVPCYNVDKFVTKCLTSILFQDFYGIEVIAIDDGSTDGTLSILKAIEAVDKRVRVFSQENQGLASTRNNGIAECRGEYIWCIDSDDYLADDILARIHRIIEQTGVELFIANYANVNESGGTHYANVVNQSYAGIVINPIADEERFLSVSGWGFRAWRYVARRQLLVDFKLKFPPGLYYEDHPFSIELITAVRKIYLDATVSYYYLQRAGSIMTDASRKVHDFLRIRRRCLELLKARRLFKRFRQHSLSYAMPADFLRYHVPASLVEEFLQELLSDSHDDEIELIVDCGGWAELAFLIGSDQTLPNRSTDVVSGSCKAVVAASSQRASLAQTLHPLSRTLSVHQIVGIDNVELHSGEGKLPTAYAWLQSREFYVRDINWADSEHRFLIVRYRNEIPGQALFVEAGEAVFVYPCQSTDLSDPSVLMVKLPEKIEGRSIRVSCGKIEARSGSEFSIWIDSIDVMGREFQLLPLKHKLATPPPISAGNGSNIGHAVVDVRTKHEPRPYLIVGEKSDVAGTFVFERGRGAIRIGDRTSIGSGCLLICAQETGISIGNDVLLSWNVTIADNNSHSIQTPIRRIDAANWTAGAKIGRLGVFKDWADVASGPIRIEDGVWIGFGATILKGVTIGKGSIVAANAVVTKDVPPYSIVAGNPAAVVREALQN